MENRNYVNSDYYTKLLREKVKRDSKVAKLQNKILNEQHKQASHLKPMCLKKPKKLPPAEKLFSNVPDERNVTDGKIKSTKEKLSTSSENSSQRSDNDLLTEIDKSIVGGMSRGFLFRKGN